MSSLFNTGGEITVGIDAPHKAQRVADGVQQWLARVGARDIRWNQDGLYFRGPSLWLNRCSMTSVKKFAHGIIHFQNKPDKVVITYSLTRALPLWTLAAMALPLAATVGAPSLTLFFCLLPLFLAMAYVIFQSGGYGFRSELQLASIRGLADGAAQELTLLQTKSQTPGAPGTFASSSSVFKSAASC